MVQIDSTAPRGTPEYEATTRHIEERTELQLDRLTRELGTFGLESHVTIAGDQINLVDAFRTVRDSEYGQIMGRWGRWRHHQGLLTPEEHHNLLGPDSKILDHSLNNALGWVELAGIQKCGPGGEKNENNLIPDDLFTVGLLAEFTHDTPEAKVEDWPAFSKNTTRSMVEELIHGDILEDLFARDMELFIKIIRMLDKRNLGGISDEDLAEAEKQYTVITKRDPGTRAKVIREAVRCRTPLDSKGAEVHGLVEQKTYFRTAERAWQNVRVARQFGGYGAIEGDRFEDNHAALAVSVLTNYIQRLTESANQYTHFRMMLWESRNIIDEVFEEDPEIMNVMLDSSDDVLGDTVKAKDEIQGQIEKFNESARIWRNFGWPRNADEFRLR